MFTILNFVVENIDESVDELKNRGTTHWSQSRFLRAPASEF
jgi:hypothetical protein